MQVSGSETSVIVSWERLTADVITHYTVYYSQISGRKRQADEMSVTVPSTENSVTITNLAPRASYQFQVTVTIVFLGEVLTGGRTQPNAMSMIMLEPTTTEAPSSTETSSNDALFVINESYSHFPISLRCSSGHHCWSDHCCRCPHYCCGSCGHIGDRAEVSTKLYCQ